MNIGLTIYGSIHTVTGGYLYDRMLVEYLREQGDQVTIISLPARNYLDHLADNFSTALNRRLARAPFDFLLQDELCHPSFFLLNSTLRGRVRYPIVSIVHLLRSSEPRAMPANALYGLIEGMYLRSVSGAICVCYDGLKRVQRMAGNSHPALVAYPPGDRLGKPMEMERITTRAKREGPLKVLFVGNLIPRKGLHILIDALARLDSARWRLTVVGDLTFDRQYTASIQERIRGHHLGKYIQLIGQADGAQLTDCYANHQVLAVPSAIEGLSMAYVEAMSFGLPVISTNSGGSAELVANGINGFLVAPGDAVSLAGAIQSVAMDRELLAQMSLAASARFAAHPKWPDTAKSIRSFLQRFPIPMPKTRPIRKD